MVASLVTFLNSILGIDPLKYAKLSTTTKKLFFNRLLYKDPRVGGVCGTNLLRFLIARFPDPVTESLTWWRKIYHHLEDSNLRSLVLEIGNPKFCLPDPSNLSILL